MGVRRPEGGCGRRQRGGQPSRRHHACASARRSARTRRRHASDVGPRESSLAIDFDDTRQPQCLESRTLAID
eukprot:3044595-Rhodomonas_salina.4